jgi:hypothetical protein
VGICTLVATTFTATVAVAPSALAGQCDLNSVLAKTVNKTGDTLTLERQHIGLTNAWCNVPDKKLVPGESDTWRAGDNLFSTELSVTYQAPNNDLVALRATMFAFTTGDADCFAIANGRLPTPYTCKAESRYDGSGGNNWNRVTFTIDKK